MLIQRRDCGPRCGLRPRPRLSESPHLLRRRWGRSALARRAIVSKGPGGGALACPLHGRFEVEQLLRFERGTGEYLVKWRGYDAWEATWEPRERLASQCTQ